MRIIVGHDDRGAAVLLQNGEHAVLGSARADGQAREWRVSDGQIANQHVLEEFELYAGAARTCPCWPINRGEVAPGLRTWPMHSNIVGCFLCAERAR